MVKWNEPYQKLATCDATGVIFVWIKHEGRWSIELINDRNSQVGKHEGRWSIELINDRNSQVGKHEGHCSIELVTIGDSQYVNMRGAGL